MSEKLKPCPYCAAEATLESWRTRKGYEASICCTSCLASVLSIVYDTEEEAVNAVTDNWNRRAAPKANEALTLEELRRMDGEPVWVQYTGMPQYGRWVIVAGADEQDGERTLYCQSDYHRDYGKTWLAYRHPPEGVEER